MLCCTYLVTYNINSGLRQQTYAEHLLVNIQAFAVGPSPMLRNVC